MSAPSSPVFHHIHKQMEFVAIRPGKFMMGCSPGDAAAYSEEKPAHLVEITGPFEIGRYQVTQAQYESVVGGNPSYFPGANLPVEGVSWNDTQQFCAKLTARKDGFIYRKTL